MKYEVRGTNLLGGKLPAQSGIKYEVRSGQNKYPTEYRQIE